MSLDEKLRVKLRRQDEIRTELLGSISMSVKEWKERNPKEPLDLRDEDDKVAGLKLYVTADAMRPQLERKIVMRRNYRRISPHFLMAITWVIRVFRHVLIPRARKNLRQRKLEGNGEQTQGGKSGRERARFCSNCEEEESTLLCPKCDLLLCSQCDKKLHREGSSAASHQRHPISSQKSRLKAQKG